MNASCGRGLGFPPRNRYSHRHTRIPVSFDVRMHMLRRLFSGIVALAALLFVFVQPAAAQQRIALVIGNAAYQKGPLQTSLADGGLIAEALTSIGFEIVEGADVNSSDLRKVFRDFLDKVNAAGPDTIAFVYYNGYALQFEGDNYLIPIDAQIERDSDIPISG